MAEQRTTQWFRERLGRITGSQAGELMGSGKAKTDVFSAKGLTYLNAVASERMIPEAIKEDDGLLEEYLWETGCQSKAMRIGAERELEARGLYAEITGNRVDETGCVAHPKIEGFSSSPDGLLNGGDGVLEIKCPTPQRYMEYLTKVKTPEDLKRFNATYYWQCVSHMAVTGARWCDFACYCPYSLKPLHIVSIERDEEEIAKLEGRVIRGLEYIDELLKAA